MNPELERKVEEFGSMNATKILVEWGNDSCRGCGDMALNAQAEWILKALQEAYELGRKEGKRDSWVDGFMHTGEGYNGEYCSNHGGNDVTREDVYRIYDELTKD
jgi:hypothetical protein